MKNLKHIELEQEEKRADIKSIDEEVKVISGQNLSCLLINKVEVNKSAKTVGVEEIHGHWVDFDFQDFSLIAKELGFDLVKREGNQ